MGTKQKEEAEPLIGRKVEPSMKRTRFLCVLLIPVALFAVNALLVYMVSPTKEQRTENRLFSTGNDIYEYRHRHGRWPSSLQDVWKDGSHALSFEEYSSDAWGNSLEYRIENDETAYLCARRDRRDDYRSMDYSHRMERRLSIRDPMFDSFAPLTNSMHDAEF